MADVTLSATPKGNGFQATVTYSDGTKATIEQEAHDVATFLEWAAEPKMEQRKTMGLSVLIFLVALSGILFAAYRKIWKDAH